MTATDEERLDLVPLDRVEAALRRSRSRHEAVLDAALDAIVLMDHEGRILEFNPAAEAMFGHDRDDVIGRSLAEVIIPPAFRAAHGRGLARYLSDGESVVLGRRIESTALRADGSEFPVELAINVVGREGPPLFAAFLRDITDRREAERRINDLSAELARRLERNAALRRIDAAITASLDLKQTLDVLIDQVMAQLGVDAADVLLFESHGGDLEFAVGRGFRTAESRRMRVRLGEGLAGRAALEHKVVRVDDLRRTPDELHGGAIAPAEGFVAYRGVPLVAKGQVKGVLEVFQRTHLDDDPEWQGFLETLAGQAAIAIDNAALFEGLQRSNLAMTLAYDATIEGWSRALDLRDRETEGHTRRVTEMTVRLARLMGFADSDLVHIRRGALLHDIGKMGIPDAILLKPGPLDDDEWAVMRRHPEYAFEMLSPISFLRLALDIPHAHHERWDGTGYPRGLKGDQIPLAARIFAVVDIWDALRSERPYRLGWPDDRVRDHIRLLSGRHLDPDVVATFLRLLDADDPARRPRDPSSARPRASLRLGTTGGSSEAASGCLG